MGKNVRYKAVMDDDSELLFESSLPVKLDVEVHPEDANVWRATDLEGSVVFIAQKVRAIMQVDEQTAQAAP
jgi:hypothetical protein